MLLTQIKEINNIILNYYDQISNSYKYNKLLNELKYNHNVVKYSNPKYNISLLESIKFNYKISI